MDTVAECAGTFAMYDAYLGLGAQYRHRPDICQALQLLHPLSCLTG